MSAAALRRIDVVGAVIVRDGCVLAAQRGASGSLPHFWEFPGGKIESNETADQALVRELREELSLEIRVGDPIVTTTHEYAFAVVTLSTFYCTSDGKPTATEHSDLRWLAPHELLSVEWAPADIPALEQVRRDLR